MHSRQTKALPAVYVQDSSLEVAWTRVTQGPDASIAGERVLALVSEGAAGFSLDYPDEWTMAEKMVDDGRATLPRPRRTADR